MGECAVKGERLFKLMKYLPQQKKTKEKKVYSRFVGGAASICLHLHLGHFAFVQSDLQ